MPRLYDLINQQAPSSQRRLGDLLNQPNEQEMLAQMRMGQATLGGALGYGERPSVMDGNAAQAYDNAELAGILSSFVPSKAALGGAIGVVGAMRQIKTEKQLAEAIAGADGKYIRWSRGPALDNKRGSSRDYVSGAEHGGFSAVPINTEWASDPEWMSRRVGEYGFLRMKDRDIAPYIYEGKKIGVDSDGYDLISDVSGVAKISPALLDEMKKKYPRTY